VSSPPAVLRIAMIGTRGVPAHYGGFETAVEEIGHRLAGAGQEVVVYRRRVTGETDPGPTYRGMSLVTLPAAPIKHLETLSHTLLSVAHQAVRNRADVALVFNAANGLLLPILRGVGIPSAVNTDGLEWKRGKWGRAGRAYFKLAERVTVRWADALIADAREIQRYLFDAYGVEAHYIPYGAPILESPGSDRLTEVGLTPGGYHLVVARLEPENNVDLIVDAYRASAAIRPLVIVGGAPYGSGVANRLRDAAGADPRVRALGPVWDQNLLDQLYANCATYLHGHSVGGTNPSLLRAMGAGAGVVAFDSPFNREVLQDAGTYFASTTDLMTAFQEAESAVSGALARDREAARRRALAEYDWDAVAGQYLDLCRHLVQARRRHSGWRRRTVAGGPV